MMQQTNIILVWFCTKKCVLSFCNEPPWDSRGRGRMSWPSLCRSDWSPCPRCAGTPPGSWGPAPCAPGRGRGGPWAPGAGGPAAQTGTWRPLMAQLWPRCRPRCPRCTWRTVSRRLYTIYTLYLLSPAPLPAPAGGVRLPLYQQITILVLTRARSCSRDTGHQAHQPRLS